MNEARKRRWYAVLQDGVEFFDSETEAEVAATDALEAARDRASEGWPEWLEFLEWGEVHVKQELHAKEVRHKPAAGTPEREAWPNNDFDVLCDYELRDV